MLRSDAKLFLKRKIITIKNSVNNSINRELNTNMFIASLSLFGNIIANSKFSVASVFSNITVDENNVKIPKASFENILVNTGIDKKTINCPITEPVKRVRKFFANLFLNFSLK
ncbi:hypothetical protein GCM10007963_14360 [Lutibacter litoralis]|nr:hypothetical protein GCM10007963_14360 [Lutibacter litoralis]